MTRKSLPNRRASRTIRVVWGQHRPFHVSLGLDPRTGEPCEVFFSDGMKSGTDMLHTVQDACVLVSMLMQHGESLHQIGHSLSDTGLIGAIVTAVIEDAKQGAPEVAW